MDLSNAPKTYRLLSSPRVYAPGLIAWAINGYGFPRDRALMVEIVRESWKIPEHAAVSLLSKAVPYSVEGDVVVFTA